MILSFGCVCYSQWIVEKKHTFTSFYGEIRLVLEWIKVNETVK